MKIDALNSSLTANKAQFFFDDAVLFMTNLINCRRRNRAETTVNQ